MMCQQVKFARPENGLAKKSVRGKQKAAIGRVPTIAAMWVAKLAEREGFEPSVQV